MPLCTICRRIEARLLVLATMFTPTSKWVQSEIRVLHSPDLLNGSFLAHQALVVEIMLVRVGFKRSYKYD